MAQLESLDHILCYYLGRGKPGRLLLRCSGRAETLRKRLKTLKNIAVKYKFQILSAFYSDVPFDKTPVAFDVISRVDVAALRPRSEFEPTFGKHVHYVFWLKLDLANYLTHTVKSFISDVKATCDGKNKIKFAVNAVADSDATAALVYVSRNSRRLFPLPRDDETVNLDEKTMVETVGGYHFIRPSPFLDAKDEESFTHLVLGSRVEIRGKIFVYDYIF